MSDVPVDEEVVEFGDIDPDDVFTEGDDEVDWSHVQELQDRYDQVLAIGDEDERRAAAVALYQEVYPGEDVGAGV